MSHLKTGQAIFKILVLMIFVYGLIIIVFDIDDEPIISTFSSVLSFCWNHVVWSIIGLVCIGAMAGLLEDMETKKASHGSSQKATNTITVLMGVASILLLLILIGAIIHVAIIIMDGEFGEILSNFSFSYGVLIPLLIALILYFILGSSG